eukprot:1493511-Rhodomonas_salina.1
MQDNKSRLLPMCHAMPEAHAGTAKKATEGSGCSRRDRGFTSTATRSGSAISASNAFPCSERSRHVPLRFLPFKVEEARRCHGRGKDSASRWQRGWRWRRGR